MKYKFGLLCLSLVMADYSYAVRTNGVNQDEEYVALAQKPQFSAVGCIYNNTPNKEAWSTGTIIDNNGTGITCAHSFDNVILKYMEDNPNCVDFLSNGYFPKLSELTDLQDIQLAWANCDAARQTWLTTLSIPLEHYYMDFAAKHVLFPQHKIVSVLVNPFYMRSLQLKEERVKRLQYDNAVIKLDSQPSNITPIPVLDIKVGQLTNGVFLGYGQGDTHHEQKRAAYVPNLTIYQSPKNGEFFSSVFFNPERPTDMEQGSDDTKIMRLKWNDEYGRPIYGHGEHGDSGGPLLIKSGNGQFSIAGVVFGGCEAKEENGKIVQLDPNQEKAQLFGNVHTGFAPLVMNNPCGPIRQELIEFMINAVNNKQQ